LRVRRLHRIHDVGDGLAHVDLLICKQKIRLITIVAADGISQPANLVGVHVEIRFLAAYKMGKLGK